MLILNPSPNPSAGSGQEKTAPACPLVAGGGVAGKGSVYDQDMVFLSI